MSLDTSRGYFSWPETFPSETAVVKCENGTGTRFCAVTGDWEKPVVTGCYVSTNELFRYIEKVRVGRLVVGSHGDHMGITWESHVAL